MNLKDVMEEIADKLSSFLSFNVFSYPIDSIQPPGGVLTYPEYINYDEAYGGGTIEFSDMPLYIVLGRADTLEARNQMSQYCDVSGNKSIKAFIDKANYSSCDHVHVVNVRFDTYPIAGVEYLIGIFRLDIQGEGV